MLELYLWKLPAPSIPRGLLDLTLQGSHWWVTRGGLCQPTESLYLLGRPSPKLLENFYLPLEAHLKITSFRKPSLTSFYRISPPMLVLPQYPAQTLVLSCSYCTMVLDLSALEDAEVHGFFHFQGCSTGQEDFMGVC